MPKKKMRKPPREFESLSGFSFVDENGRVRADTSANIYESMILSPAFMDLTSKQQVLYIFCKAQFYGKRKPGKDFPDEPRLQSDDLFYLNWDLVCNHYRLYGEKSRGHFYKDMKSLSGHGFIEIVVNGKAQHRKNVYRFSSGWKVWKAEQ